MWDFAVYGFPFAFLLFLSEWMTNSWWIKRISVDFSFYIWINFNTFLTIFKFYSISSFLYNVEICAYGESHLPDHHHTSMNQISWSMSAGQMENSVRLSRMMIWKWQAASYCSFYIMFTQKKKLISRDFEQKMVSSCILWYVLRTVIKTVLIFMSNVVQTKAKIGIMI